MEIDFTLWSLLDILKLIPFDTSIDKQCIALDLNKISLPQFIKDNFQVFFIYDKNDNSPYDACCSLYSPTNSKKIGIVIIIKQKYEIALKTWLTAKNENYLDDCCRRRELYCHEVSHLIAMLRAFTGGRFSVARDDFRTISLEKFKKSLKTAEELKPVRVSGVKTDTSPSIFDKEHFRYGNDSLNYFHLYQDLVLPYDRMDNAIVPICKHYTESGDITFEHIAQETLVSKNFFDIFPEKLTALRELLSKEIFGKID
jgi:hypothetical protein